MTNCELFCSNDDLDIYTENNKIQKAKWMVGGWWVVGWWYARQNIGQSANYLLLVLKSL